MNYKGNQKQHQYFSNKFQSLLKWVLKISNLFYYILDFIDKFDQFKLTKLNRFLFTLMDLWLIKSYAPLLVIITH